MVVEMVLVTGSKSSTGSMSTAREVFGSATTYCQVQVGRWKKVWAIGPAPMCVRKGTAGCELEEVSCGEWSLSGGAHDC